MCLSCNRNENRRLYLFMQLSVMMMFSGQSTWEKTRKQKDRHQQVKWELAKTGERGGEGRGGGMCECRELDKEGERIVMGKRCERGGGDKKEREKESKHK